MENHNFPSKSMTDGRCGPDNGPNCPACRTIKTEKMDTLNKNGKWQGYSGMIYCKKTMEPNSLGQVEVCGPDNGKPWDECMIEILEEDRSFEEDKFLEKEDFASAFWIESQNYPGNKNQKLFHFTFQ